jgi:hypothetical protein
MNTQIDTAVQTATSTAEQADTLQALDLDQLAQVGGGGFYLNE